MLLYYHSILRICYLLFFLYREKVNLQKEISEAEEAIRKRKTEIEVFDLSFYDLIEANRFFSYIVKFTIVNLSFFTLQRAY